MTMTLQLELFQTDTDPSQPIRNPFVVPVATLSRVIECVTNSALTPTRKRDCISAVRKFAALTQQPLETAPALVSDIRARLDAFPPPTRDRAKTWSNFKSNLLSALQVGGASCVLRTANVPLSPAWQQLRAKVPHRRTRSGLSRFMRFCSLNDHQPEQVDDAVFGAFREALRTGTVVRNVEDLERQVAKLWNGLAQADLPISLRRLEPPVRPQTRRARVSFGDLPCSFREDLERHLNRAGFIELFEDNPRSRPLAEGTLWLRRQYVLTAVTALVQAGTPPAEIRTLADLCNPDSLKRVLQQLGVKPGGCCSAYHRGIAKALVAIAGEWLQPPAETLKQMRRILAQIGPQRLELTDKNKALLRTLDDPICLGRLITLPDKLWSRVKRAPISMLTLSNAQAALAIDILLSVPLRRANLASLAFDRNLFLSERKGAEAALEIAAEGMKNREPFSAVLPAEVAERLRWYRNELLRPLLHSQPVFLFDNGRGKPKRPTAVSSLIETAIRRHLGIKMTAHQFRHLAAKIVLDSNPGAYELTRQLLGHKSVTTTTNFYAGMDAARAIRHHNELIRAKRERMKDQRPTSRSGRGSKKV